MGGRRPSRQAKSVANTKITTEPTRKVPSKKNLSVKLDNASEGSRMSANSILPPLLELGPRALVHQHGNVLSSPSSSPLFSNAPVGSSVQHQLPSSSSGRGLGRFPAKESAFRPDLFLKHQKTSTKVVDYSGSDSSSDDSSTPFARCNPFQQVGDDRSNSSGPAQKSRDEINPDLHTTNKIQSRKPPTSIELKTASAFRQSLNYSANLLHHSKEKAIDPEESDAFSRSGSSLHISEASDSDISTYSKHIKVSRPKKKNKADESTVPSENSELSDVTGEDVNSRTGITRRSPLRQAMTNSTLVSKPCDVVFPKRTQSSAPSKERTHTQAASLSPDLPQFDVKEILDDKLSSSDKDRNTLLRLQSNPSNLTKTQRKAMVRVLVRWLYVNHVSDPKSVTSDMKDGLAKSIVTAYPELACINQASENLSPWSQYYNRQKNSGWIPNCARHIQKKHRTRKHTKTAAAEEDPGSSEYDSDQIDKLGQRMVNLRTKPDILRGMTRCFKTRKVERKRGESITFFIKKYPHFKHFEGEIIFQEYELMFSGAIDLQTPFVEKLERILSLAPIRRINLKLDDEILRALMLLSHHLPHDIPIRGEKYNYSWAQEEDLFVVLDPNDSVRDFIAERVKNSEKNIQPYMIMVQSPIDHEITSLFIVLDSKELEISCSSRNPTLQAFSVLMQCYCVFNVLHPFGWRNTLHFVQHFFMNIREKQYHRSSRGGDHTSPSETELWEKLQ